MSSLSSRQAGSVATAREARSVKSDPAEENWRLRQNLALSYRVINDLALNEGSCNHLSVMSPPASGEGEEVMLIAPGHLPQGGGIDWSRVTATSILGLDRAGAVVE